MTERMATDLLSDPAIPDVGDMPEMLSGTPYDKAYNLLSSTEGKNLEIMTRTNPRLVQAATASYTLVAAFGTQFVRGKTDQFLRFAVSMGGQGRQEIVESLRAGGDMPDAYFEAQMGKSSTPRTFTDAVDDEDE